MAEQRKKALFSAAEGRDGRNFINKFQLYGAVEALHLPLPVLLVMLLWQRRAVLRAKTFMVNTPTHD